MYPPSFSNDLRTYNNKNYKFNKTKKTKLYTSLPSFSPKGNILPGQTVLITISTYHPFYEKKNQISNEQDAPYCKNTIQFYDTQTLQDLKQVFRCKNEKSEISGDISNNIHKPLGKLKIVFIFKILS